MSGVVDFVTEKIFKPVRNFVKKVWDNKVIRGVIIAAAIVYTAGVASGAWTWTLQAPAATTYTAVAAETGAAAAASNVTVGSVAGAGEGAIAGTAMAGNEVGAAAAMAAPAAQAAPLAGSAGGAAGVGEGAMAGGVSNAAEAAAYEASLSSVPESAGIVGDVMNGIGSTGRWMADNPMATMMVGSGIANASAEREARKTAEDQRAHEIAMKANVGLGGYNNLGAYNAPANVAPTAQPGVVQGAAGIPLTGNAAAARPIQRSSLPALQKQGLIAGQPIQLRG